MDSKAQCEKCGVTFTPTGTGEVVSARILCPTCEAAKRQERAAKAKGQAPLRPSPAAPAGVKAAPAAPAAKPAVARPAAARPSAPQPAAAKAPAAAAAADRARSPAASRTAPPRAAAAPGGKPAHPHHHLASADQTAKIAKIGWIAALAFLVIGGVILAVVMSKHRTDRQREKEYTRSLNELGDQLAAADLETMAGAQAAIDLVTSKKELWNNSRLEQSALDVESRAKRAIERLREQEAIVQQLDQAEAQLANAQALTLQQLEDAVVQVRGLQPKVRDLGDEIVARFTTLRNQGQQTLVTKLSAEAKAMAERGGADWRATLNLFARAEDQLQTLATQAALDKDAEGGKRYAEMRTEMIRASDAFSDRVLTRDVIEQVPWRNLLAPGMEKEWLAGGPVEHRLAEGKLIAIGLPGGKGVVSTKQQWRDLVLDIEFAVDRGKAELYFRVQEKADSSQVPSLTLGVDGAIPATPGTPTSVTISLIGSKLSAQIGGTSLDEQIPARKMRHGVIAIAPDSGTALTITRLQIRELR
jgi:hypothetical protein